jgi:hypothetical protein
MNKEMKAFPSENDSRKSYHYVNKGMDLRDYFAAKAMPSLVKTLEHHITTPSDVAELAYKYADAMMEAREK